MSGLAAALHPVCTAAFIAVVALLAVVTARALVKAREAERRSWLGLAVAAFLLALALRLAVEPLPSNWYSDVLPPHGDASWERFGPGMFVFEGALRAVFRWSDTTVFSADAVVGALAIFPYAALLREAGLDGFEAAVALGLFALSPIHVRVSASASEHVLTSTLTLLSLWAWTRGIARRDLFASALALACIPATALTRPDAWPELVMIPLWPWLATPAPRRRAALGAVVFGCVWLVVGAAVLARAEHPLPTPLAMAGTALALVPQFFVLALLPPFWFSPLALALSLVGAVAAWRTRRRLLGCVALSIGLIFVPLGRQVGTTGVVGARYFLVAFAVLGVLAGLGAGRARAFAKARSLPEVSIAAVFAAACVAFTVPALRARSTFQDEYAFLRRYLRELPEGCTVASIPVSGEGFEQDIDTALDVPRSTLTIAYPKLAFTTLDDGWRPPDHGCVAVYESALCAIADTAEVRRRFSHARDVTFARCERARSFEGRVVAEGEVSTRSLYDVFGDVRPRVRLALDQRRAGP